MDKTNASLVSHALTRRVLTYLDALYPRMRGTLQRELRIRNGVFGRA